VIPAWSQAVTTIYELRNRPAPRYAARSTPSTLTYTAACPHGVDVEWTAIRDDSRSHADRRCKCPEEAA
jgi:hypothetical protein